MKLQKPLNAGDHCKWLYTENDQSSILTTNLQYPSIYDNQSSSVDHEKSQVSVDQFNGKLGWSSQSIDQQLHHISLKNQNSQKHNNLQSKRLKTIIQANMGRLQQHNHGSEGRDQGLSKGLQIDPLVDEESILAASNCSIHQGSIQTNFEKSKVIYQTNSRHKVSNKLSRTLKKYIGEIGVDGIRKKVDGNLNSLNKNASTDSFKPIIEGPLYGSRMSIPLTTDDNNQNNRSINATKLQGSRNKDHASFSDLKFKAKKIEDLQLKQSVKEKGVVDSSRSDRKELVQNMEFMHNRANKTHSLVNQKYLAKQKILRNTNQSQLKRLDDRSTDKNHQSSYYSPSKIEMEESSMYFGASGSASYIVDQLHQSKQNHI